MSLAILINGEQLVEQKLKNLTTDTTALKQAVLAGALMVEKSAKENIAQSEHSGRVYVNHGVVHQASAPGESPATDTGTLISSIQHWASGDGLTVAVGSRLNYATYLEYGTTKMAERPFLGPALDVNREDIIKRILAALKGMETNAS